MVDYAPPTGPPPPKVPEGWKAVWNDQYKEWFYVNIHTKQSQWDKPTEPVYAAPDSDPLAPSGAPPGYDHSSTKSTGPEKGGLDSNNPFRKSQQDISEDERLARQLQEEENKRAGVGSSADRGEADTYYQDGGAAGAYSQPGGPAASGELPPRPDQDRSGKGKGLFGKLFNKNKTSYQQPYASPPGQYYPPQQGYGAGPGYGPQQGYYPPPQGGYGGYPPQQQAYGRRPGGGGLGTAGAAALGVGGGLLGGALLADAFEGHDGGGDGGGYGGDDGGFGGDGGGDFGGGGDF